MNAVVMKMYHRVLALCFQMFSMCLKMARSLTDLFIPGRAVAIDGERSDEKLDGEALVEQSLKLTAGLKELVQENKDLKEELHQLQQKPRVSGGDLG